MQVEARLIRRTQDASSSLSSGTGSGVSLQLSEGDDGHFKSRSWNVTTEFRSWARLFSKKFIDRTWIGILMMVFQRECVRVFLVIQFCHLFPRVLLAFPPGYRPSPPSRFFCITGPERVEDSRSSRTREISHA